MMEIILVNSPVILIGFFLYILPQRFAFAEQIDAIVASTVPPRLFPFPPLQILNESIRAQLGSYSNKYNHNNPTILPA